MGYLRQDTPNGRLYRILLDIYQLVLGVGFHILEDTQTELPHAETNMIEFIRNQAGERNIHFKITGAWIPRMIREGDRNLMEDFISLGLDQQYLRQMNYCRLYLNVLTLADIVDHKGIHLERWAWEGRRERSSNIQWPRQERPRERV